VVLYVRELERSGAFYREVVGLQPVGRIFNGRAEVFSGGRTHHELLLIEVGDAPGPLQGRRLGLYHTGWKVGERLDDLREARRRVEAFGAAVDGLADHTVSRSLYLRDPDGNEVELYVDDPAYDWRENSDWLEAPIKELEL
jgi:catechol 2,3-dioxygenase